METLGQVLKRYRESRGVSAEYFANIIKIPAGLLLLLEDNQLEKLPGDYAIRNYLKIYARYLELDPTKLVTLYEAQIAANQLLTKEKEVSLVNIKNRAFITPNGIKIGLLSLVIFILLGYLGWQVRQIYLPPHLEITSPLTDISISERYIEIIGSVSKESQIFINDKEVFADSNGIFRATLDLQSGLNLIKVSAKKKHSAESVIYRKILVQ